jgi:hypothetical protein
VCKEYSSTFPFVRKEKRNIHLGVEGWIDENWGIFSLSTKVIPESRKRETD